MTLTVPPTLAATLAPEMLSALEAKLAPAPALRAKARLEFELECAGEGTFTIVVDGPAPMTAKKGFAKDPFLSVHIAKGGWALLQRELQALADGLPNAPALAKHVESLKNPKPGELDALIAAARKIVDASVRFDVRASPESSGGTYAVARGPVDEATRTLTIALDAAEIERVLAGQAPPTSIKAGIGGDRGVLATVASSMAPMLERLKS